jgi:lambda repressor-like predicted transcriptional regulator
MKGWIYKITHKSKETGENDYPAHCYIGQTRVSIKDRWNQHCNACLNYEPLPLSRQRGKQAALYEAMAVLRIENFVIEQLAEYEQSDESELAIILVESEIRFIDEYDSIEKGWNTKKATKASVRKSGEKTLAALAKENGVAVSSLRHRINKKHETIEQAIAYLANKKNNPSTIYIYKRQRFHTLVEISESKVHNPYSVPRKTIEKKVRDLRKNKTIEQLSDKEENLIILTLTDDIFEPIKSRNISVVTPSGETITGSKKELHESLYYQHPDLVPDKYTTLISRLGKPNWSNEQAFGFEYPPDLMHIKPFIETGGYIWANKEKPDFVRQDGKPVVLHETKEVFLTQTKFADAYGLKIDAVSEMLNEKGMTAIEILRQYGLEP